MTTLRKIIDAYNDGANGEPLADNARHLPRFAHLRGEKAFARIALIGQQEHAQKMAEFREVMGNARGLNKKVIEIIETDANIPNQAKSDVLRSYRFRDENGVYSSQWTIPPLGLGDRGETATYNTPLVRDIGRVHLDNIHWAHNGFNIPVRSFGVTVSAIRRIDGTLGDVTSNIDINPPHYDPDNVQLDYNDDFTGGIRIAIDANGQIEKIERSSSSSTGYVTEDLSDASINFGTLLEQVHAAVTDTVLAYRTDDIKSEES